MSRLMVGKNILPRIESFDFPPGRVLARKYEVVERIGAGWEGEVYRIRERATGIERAAKFFFPQRNPHDRALRFYAKKLHKLRHCPLLIQYHTRETTTFDDLSISFLVSEFVEGEMLSQFINRHPGKRLRPFEALHVLHALAVGMQPVHHIKEYHGDLHTDNVIIKRFGIGFDIKLVDPFFGGTPSARRIQTDVIELVRIFYDMLGGQKHYAAQPRVVKDICCGLKKSLILSRFRNAGRLRGYIENISWDENDKF